VAKEGVSQYMQKCGTEISGPKPFKLIKQSMASGKDSANTQKYFRNNLNKQKCYRTKMKHITSSKNNYCQQ
jgi:hypothetical protein